MWLYCKGTDSPVPDSPIPNIVLYDYQFSRGGRCAVDFLDHYRGYLQVDGYTGYAQTSAALVGCMAHARRKFMGAKQSQANGKSGKADMALNLIQQLYAIEKSLRDSCSDQTYQTRQEKSVPLLNKFKPGWTNHRCRLPPNQNQRTPLNTA